MPAPAGRSKDNLFVFQQERQPSILFENIPRKTGSLDNGPVFVSVLTAAKKFTSSRNILWYINK